MAIQDSSQTFLQQMGYTGVSITDNLNSYLLNGGSGSTTASALSTTYFARDHVNQTVVVKDAVPPYLAFSDGLSWRKADGTLIINDPVLLASIKAVTKYNPINTDLITGLTETASSVYMPFTVTTDCSSLVFGTYNWMKKTNADPNSVISSQLIGNTLTVSAVALEWGGVSKPMPYDTALRSTTMSDGQSKQFTAALPASAFGLSVFPAGGSGVIKFDLLIPSGGNMPITDKYFPGFTGTTAQCISYNPANTTVSSIDTVGQRTVTGTAATTRNKWYNGFVMGVPVDQNAPSVMFVGDSITAGYNDDVFPQPYGPGYAARTMELFTTGVGCLNFASVGWYTRQQVPDARMQAWLLHVNKATVMLGANDFIQNRGGVATTVFSQLQQVVSGVKTGGVKSVAVYKITPATTSSDGWNSATQSPTSGYEAGGQVDQYNAMIAAANFDAVVTTNSARDTTNTNIWAYGSGSNNYTKDGIHTQKPMNTRLASEGKPILSALWGVS